MSQPLANDPGELRDEVRTLVIGSGYGGAITAARLAEAGHDVVLFERGKEWIPGEFPDTGKALARNLRRGSNPLGLFDYYLCKDIDVLKGNGLGGTSLVNANVAIRPDPELFLDPRWPKAYRDLAASGEIWGYYERAERMLAVNPHPDWHDLTKVQMVAKRAEQVHDHKFGPAPLAVHFGPEGPNHVGVHQKPCINCNDCVTGCNVTAKNTLYMNYLPYAKQKGVKIFTQLEVRWLEARPGGGWTVCYRRGEEHGVGEVRTLVAGNVVLAAGTLGSTEVLLRSAAQGLATSRHLGGDFSGNGDVLGLAYNTNHRTNVLGFGNHPDSERAAIRPGPTIVSAVQYDRSKPFGQRITIEDFTTFPSGLVDTFRRALPPLALTGKDTDPGFRHELEEAARVGRDLIKWDPDGACNHSMVYLVMAVDDAGGRMSLTPKDKVEIDWPTLATDPIFARIKDELLAHTQALGGTFVRLDRWNPWAGRGNLITAHPLGGCRLGDDADTGVVDPDGRVFDGRGGVHQGLYVVDGAILPTPLGVNPFITISALAERIGERLAGALAA